MQEKEEAEEDKCWMTDEQNNSSTPLDIFHKSNLYTQNRDKITTHICSQTFYKYVLNSIQKYVPHLHSK